MRRILMTFCLLFSCVIFAQQNAIIGKITDVAFNNEPLAFANVYIKGTSKGVTSDIDGIYALENCRCLKYDDWFWLDNTNQKWQI